MFVELFLITVTLPPNVLPLKYTSLVAEGFTLILAPKFVPEKVCVAPVALNVPLLHCPPVAESTPVVVSVLPPKFNTPVVIVKLTIEIDDGKIQLLPPVTMITLSAAPGVPFGVQLVGVFHAVEVAPFHV